MFDKNIREILLQSYNFKMITFLYYVHYQQGVNKKYRLLLDFSISSKTTIVESYEGLKNNNKL